MQELVGVDIFEREHDLCQPAEDDLFVDVVAILPAAPKFAQPLCAAISLGHAPRVGDMMEDIPAVGVLHDDAQESVVEVRLLQLR